MSTTSLPLPVEAPDRVRSQPARRPAKRRRGLLVATLIAYLITFVILLPLLWIVLLSFRRSDQILSHPFAFSDFTAQNYRTVVSTLNLMLMYRNTFILAVVSVSIGLVISFMAAFALTRMVLRTRSLRVRPAEVRSAT